jgi:translation initiation factor IF-3
MIRIPQVRVVDEEGNQLGVMPTPRALEMAQERGYDLVEVAPMASPPVARFLDFGQYKYELTKREKEAKKRQRVGFKEVRLSPKIGQGDFDTKVHRAIEFLEEGDRIKVTVRFRGRELTHPELGRNLLTKFTETIKEHGTVERAPLLEGKQMHVTVASLHKPKVHEAAQPARPTPAEAKPKLAEGTPAEATPTATAEPKAATEPTATSEPKPAAVAEPKPAATAEPKPAAVAEPKPAAVAEPKPAAVAEPKPASEPKPAAPAAQASQGRQATPTAVSTGE